MELGDVRRAALMRAIRTMEEATLDGQVVYDDHSIRIVAFPSCIRVTVVQAIDAAVFNWCKRHGTVMRIARNVLEFKPTKRNR